MELFVIDYLLTSSEGRTNIRCGDSDLVFGKSLLF